VRRVGRVSTATQSGASSEDELKQFSIKDARARAEHDDALFQVQTDRRREHGALDVRAAARHVRDVVAVRDVDHVLGDDRTGVQLRR
jgi:hypothetical protein